jgi:hypothetical protein
MEPLSFEALLAELSPHAQSEPVNTAFFSTLLCLSVYTIGSQTRSDDDYSTVLG